MFDCACLRNTEARWTQRGAAALVAAVALSISFAVPLSAQRGQRNGQSQGNNLPVEVPDSTNELPRDIGARVHTNHLILLRPEQRQRVRSTTPVGETPGSLACVYETVSQTSGCPITGKLANGNNGLPNPSGGSGTVAVVDAYDYPTAQKDFAVFSNQFGLPCTNQGSPSASNCSDQFQQVYATGSKPAANGSWALEEALDIEWAHAMAPGAKIVLVEAASNSYADLFTAVDVAGNEVSCGTATSCTGGTGFGEVSMSWGGSEFSTESSYDQHFQTYGVVYFAAAGDSGGKTIYPSVSPYVVSAGGTTVNRNSSGNFISETAWSSGGGGRSAYEPVPLYQAPVENLVGTKRGTPDFSFDSNPNSGVFVYDSTPYNGSEGWWIIGGTSVASPSLAGIVNLASSAHAFQSSSTNELGLIYSICGSGSSTCSSADFRDITSGSAGHYTAAVGWDFTTGVGSNQGLSGK
jgi:subtilase family serine protease